MSRNTDTALEAFLTTKVGTAVAAICADPERVAEMKTLAAHGLTPVRVLETHLPMEVKRDLGARFENSQCGKAVRNAIADTHVPSGDREKNLRGAFKSGALYIRR
jgi:hypothetical protein